MENFNNITWDQYFMYVAEVSAMKSKDPKTKVGACIASPKTHHILSIGYNGFPTKFPETAEIWDSDEKHKYVVHAEANAILNTLADLSNSVLYVTMFPCHECAKLLAQKGVSEIVYKDDKFISKDTGKISLDIFNKLGIKIRQFEGPSLKEYFNGN